MSPVPRQARPRRKRVRSPNPAWWPRARPRQDSTDPAISTVVILRRRRHENRRSLDASDYTVETPYCSECGTYYARATGFVNRGDVPVAAFYAVCHGHPDHEVAIDVILGTWGKDEHGDHETFSCVLRRDGAMAVDPFVTLSFGPGDELPPVLGRAVPRAEALDSERLPLLWEVVDALVLDVEPVAEQYNA